MCTSRSTHCYGCTIRTSWLSTHWGRDKMAAISQTTLSNAFFVNENARISIEISLKLVPKGPINNIPALVQIMAWRRPGDKPLSEPMMVRLPTHICVTLPQWVNSNDCGTFLRKISSLPLDINSSPLVPNICTSVLGQHCFRQWLVACSVPSHYLNQCWFVVNWMFRNNFQWKFIRNPYIFIKKNECENTVSEMAAILSRGWWVNFKW